MTAASESIGLKSMLRDFGVEAEAHLQVDASAAIGIAQRKGLGKVRHLDCQALWIQDAVRQKRIHLEKVLGTENPADLMTKNLDQKSMDKMLEKMGISLPAGRSQIAPTTGKSGGVQLESMKTQKKEVQEIQVKEKGKVQRNGGKGVQEPTFATIF